MGTKIENFREKVLDIVSSIPIGEIMTYKEVSHLAGRPRASRAVGTIMKNNYDLTVPCHRVVRSDGIVGDYNRGGKENKIKKLKSEGVKFIEKDKIIFMVQ
jgi:O-6-methylguanine DNA methyltransferase